MFNIGDKVECDGFIYIITKAIPTKSEMRYEVASHPGTYPEKLFKKKKIKINLNKD